MRGVYTYHRAKRNLLAAIAKGVPVGILYCLNSTNIDCIPDFIEEWADRGTLGILFTAYAPMEGRDSYLSINDAQRDKSVSILMQMKKEFGRLVVNTEKMIELIRATYGKQLARNCPMNILNERGNVLSFHMCQDGSIRLPCALGRDADCLHCRSVTKMALYAGLVLRDKRSLLAAFRMYHSKSHRARESN